MNNLLLINESYIDTLFFRLLTLQTLVKLIWQDTVDDDNKYGDIWYGLAAQLESMGEELREKYSEAEMTTFKNKDLLRRVQA